MPAAASRPAGAAVLAGARAELDRLEAAVAWLDRALVRAEPVKAELTTVEPVVDTKVDEPLVTVETSAEVVTAVAGIEVAPPTPSRPEMVVVPVLVRVDPPLVMTVVNVLVAIADDEPPKIVVEPRVEVTVEPPVVMTVTMGEVVMAAEDRAPPAPPEPEALPEPLAELPAPPAPPVVEAPEPAPAPPLVVVTGLAVTEAGTETPWPAQKEVPNCTTCPAAVSFWQCW